jgi:hypothetical protein
MNLLYGKLPQLTRDEHKMNLMILYLLCVLLFTLTMCPKYIHICLSSQLYYVILYLLYDLLFTMTMCLIYTHIYMPSQFYHIQLDISRIHFHCVTCAPSPPKLCGTLTHTTVL